MRGATMFSGIAAPEVALPWVDWRWCAEVEPFPCAVLEARHPHIPNLGDVTGNAFIDEARTHGPLDLLVGGPPCQGFSVAGLRGSLSDARGNLSLIYAKVINELNPTVSLTENVPGWLSTTDNAFGCFLGALVGSDSELVPPAGMRWTDAGMVVGPKRTAAWRILDAQWFGLAQRRERVFVVASARGSRVHPGRILLVEAGVPGYPPSREEEGKDVTGSLAARTGAGGDVAMTLNAKGGVGRNNPDETFVVAHSLRGEGVDASEDGTGRGIPLVPVAFRACGQEGFTASEVSPPILSSDGGGAGVPTCVVPILEAGARTGKSTTDLRAGSGIGEDGDPMYTLQSGKQHAIAFNLRGREGGSMPEVSDVASLRAASGGSSRSYVALPQGYRVQDVNGPRETISCNPNGGMRVSPVAYESGVRRLTVVETARLQGFPDLYLHIEDKRKKNGRKISFGMARYLMSHGLRCYQQGGQWRTRIVADGPMYKAIGNSMPVPVIAWIGNRIREAM